MTSSRNPLGRPDGGSIMCISERLTPQESRTKLAQAPDDSRARSTLGLTLVSLGEVSAAVREGKAAVEQMPVEREAYRGAYRLEDLARIYALVGSGRLLWRHSTAFCRFRTICPLPECDWIRRSGLCEVTPRSRIY